MRNVSFKANLIIDPNIYNKPPQASAYDPEGLIAEYKKILEVPAIKKVTEGDTVKISKCAYTERDGIFKEGEKKRKKQGWGIIIEFVSDKLQKPFVWPVCFGENSTSSPRLYDFAAATIDFLGQKAGVAPGARETKEAFAIRAVGILKKSK